MKFIHGINFQRKSVGIKLHIFCANVPKWFQLKQHLFVNSKKDKILNM